MPFVLQMHGRETFNFDQTQCKQYFDQTQCKAGVHGSLLAEVVSEANQELLAGHSLKCNVSIETSFRSTGF